MTQHHRLELADYIHELTQPHKHAAEYELRVGLHTRTLKHITTAPPLLTQLWDNDIPSAVAEEGPRPGFASKPAARLEALATAARIDLYAEQWIHKLGATPRSSDTTVMVRQLHGLSANQDHTTRRDIENDVRRWWIWARVVTGWDAPAWKPDATCPQCGVRGSIRIRLADQKATCIEDACRATWDEHTIGLLAEHIRDETDTETTPRYGPGPCWCPIPQPEFQLSHLCPRCGSARCHRALGRRLIDQLRDGAA